jgi:large subunit ribosomal protein L15
MKLGELRPAKGATKKRKRIGRGAGSGTGGTSTMGHKGHKARKGHQFRPWFEGGQMPLQRRTPKRGFTNVHRKPLCVVNVGDLERLGLDTVDAAVLKENGFIRSATARLKVLGNGEITRAVKITAHGFSAEAQRKIEAAGGSVETIKIVRPKRYKKKVQADR